MSIPKPFWQLLTEDPARSWSLSIYTTSAQLAYLPRHGRNPEDAAQGSVSKSEVCSIKCIYESFSRVLTRPLHLSYSCVCVIWSIRDCNTSFLPMSLAGSVLLWKKWRNWKSTWDCAELSSKDSVLSFPWPSPSPSFPSPTFSSLSSSPLLTSSCRASFLLAVFDR